jgi:zinc transporter ZupT
VHRKRSGGQQPSEDEQSGSGAAIAVGALLDGVPESVVLGLGLIGGGSVSASVLAAVFISNVPEGLSSAAGMKAGGRSARYVFGVWGGIALVSGLAALVGYVALGGAAPEVIAVITATAAGHPDDGRRHHDPRGVRADPHLDRRHHHARLPRRLRHRGGLRLRLPGGPGRVGS